MEREVIDVIEAITRFERLTGLSAAPLYEAVLCWSWTEYERRYQMAFPTGPSKARPGGGLPLASWSDDRRSVVVDAEAAHELGILPLVKAHELFHLPQVYCFDFYEWCEGWFDHDRLTRMTAGYAAYPGFSLRRRSPIPDCRRFLERTADLYAAAATEGEIEGMSPQLIELGFELISGVAGRSWEMSPDPLF